MDANLFTHPFLARLLELGILREEVVGAINISEDDLQQAEHGAMDRWPYDLVVALERLCEQIDVAYAARRATWHRWLRQPLAGAQTPTPADLVRHGKMPQFVQLATGQLTPAQVLSSWEVMWNQVGKAAPGWRFAERSDGQIALSEDLEL